MLRSEPLGGQLLRTWDSLCCLEELETSEGLCGGVPFGEQDPGGNHVGTGLRSCHKKRGWVGQTSWHSSSSVSLIQVTSYNLETRPNLPGLLGYRCCGPEIWEENTLGLDLDMSGVRPIQEESSWTKLRKTGWASVSPFIRQDQGYFPHWVAGKPRMSALDSCQQREPLITDSWVLATRMHRPKSSQTF